MNTLDPEKIIIPDLDEGLNPDRIILPDLSAETGPLGMGEDALYGQSDNLGRLGGSLVSGAKRVPGDVARGLAVESREIAARLKPTARDDDAWYGTQFQLMSPMERMAVSQRANEKVGLGVDRNTAMRDSMNEMLDEKRIIAHTTADAMDKVAEAKAFGPLPGYEHPDNFAEAVAQGIGQQAVRLPMMFLAPWLAVPEMYLEISGATYKSLTDQGVDPERARAASRMDAVAQAPLEFLGDLVTIKAMLGATGWKALVAGIAKSTGTEGLEEFAQQYPDELATYWAMNPDATNQDIMDHLSSGKVLQEALYAGAIGGVTGGILAGAGGATHSLLNQYITDKQKGKIEERKQTFLDALAKARTGEKLSDEEQETVNQVMDKLPEDAFKRIQFQTPIISDARDEAYQGMLSIMENDQAKTDAVMTILDSVAHAYGDLLGVDPEVFYEKELKVGGKISFEEFQDDERLAAQYQVAAWHGSPHSFEKFSTDKIGSGEGAQSYGYGLYFTDKKEIAEHYKRSVAASRTKDSDHSEALKVSDPEAYALIEKALEKDDFYGTGPLAVGHIVSQLMSGRTSMKALGLLGEDFDRVNKAASTLTAPGHVYEVELAPDDDEFLLWDAIWDDQSDKIKSTLEKSEHWEYAKDRLEEWETRSGNNFTGREIYKDLLEDMDKKEASDFLHSLGIRGIKYLNGDSRSKGEGDYNYVVFSDEDVKVKARFQGAPAAPMGATAWTSEGQAIIYAFEGSNVSTPIHEIGHVLLGLIERYDPSSFKAIQSWLKIDENRSILGSQAWTEEEHEKFAKGFEVYMMEGRAPTFRLVSVFKKMKTLLLEVYRRITKLNVKLNDDVRRVFDQWLTTEDDRAGDFILDASNWYNVDEAPHPFGNINPDDYQDYDAIAAKASEVAAKKVGAKRKRQDAKVRMKLWQQARAIIEDDPFWQDIAYLKSVGGLSLNLVKKMGNWGRDEIKVFREWGIISGKSNLSPDGYAHSRSMLGNRKYDRAEEFLDMVIDSPRKKDAINKVYADFVAEYEQWLEQEGPILGDVGEILDAEIAILNALMGRTTAASKVLQKKIGNVEDLTYEEVQALKKEYADLDKAAREAYGEGEQKARSAADQKIVDLKVKQKERIAEIRAKNIEKVLKLKEQQRLVVAKLRERQRVQKEKAKINRRFKRYLKMSLSYEAKYQLRRLLNGYYKVKEFKPDYEQPDLTTYLNREIPIQGAQEYVSGMVEDLPTPWRDDNNNVMTPGRRSLSGLQAVAAIADFIVGLDRMKTEEIKRGKMEQRRLLAEGIYDKHGVVPSEQKYMVSDRPGWFDTIKEGKDKFIAELTKIEFLCNYLDRLEAIGPVWQSLFKPLADAENKKLVMLRQYMKDLHSILDPVAQDISWTRKKYHVSGYGKPLTREQMFMIALNSGNEGNRKDLIEGNKIPEEVIDRIFNEELTDQEREAVAKIWGLLDSLYPHLDQVNRSLLGMPLKKVEGHYFPIVHDRKLSWLAAKTQDQNAMPGEVGPNYMAYPKAGHRDARTGAVRPIKLNDIEVVAEHIHRAVHDITHTIPVMEIYRTFTDENVRKAIIDIAGEEMYNMLTPWIKNVSRPTSEMSSKLESIARGLRKNTTVVFLGFKATTEVLQLSALTQSIEELGAVQVGEAVLKMMESPIEMVTMISEKSAMMRFRGKMYDREFNDFAQQISMNTISKYTDRIGEMVLSPIAMLDLCAAYPTWLAAYEKGLTQFKDKDGQPIEEKAVDFADSTVRRTQSAAGPKDLAVIQQGNEFKKWAAMFYTFFSVYWNKVNESHKRAGIEGLLTPDAHLHLFRSFVYLTAIPAILSFLIVKERFPEEDEWWKELVAYRIGGWPVVRDLVSPALSGYDYEFSPAAGGFSAIAELLKDTDRARKKWLEGDEISGGELMKDIVWAAGYIYGLPSSQTMITMDGLIDLWNDETDNPLRLLFREPREYKE